MRDAITVLQLAHAISSRRCLLPSCLFFWPPEAAPSRPPLPPLPAAILVISGETQLRYFAPDLGFHSIPRPRVEIRGRKTRGQVYEASSSDVVVVAASIARDEDGNGWESMEQEKERGFVRRRGGGGDINAMIRFVITSIRDMACGWKSLLGLIAPPCFSNGRLTVHTLISR